MVHSPRAWLVAVGVFVFAVEVGVFVTTWAGGRSLEAQCNRLRPAAITAARRPESLSLLTSFILRTPKQTANRQGRLADAHE